MDQAKRLLTIGQMAGEMGVATTALRFYERAGLIQPTERSRAGYRLYDASAVERLRFIRAGQAVGFTLEDIRSLLDLDDEQTGEILTSLAATCHQREQDFVEWISPMTMIPIHAGSLRSSSRRTARDRGFRD